MKIAYITAQTPFGSSETFILEEIIAIKELGADVLVIPRNPPRGIYHNAAQQLLDCTIWLPLINWRILREFVKGMLLNYRLRHLLLEVIQYSRTLKILAKNIAVIPKAVFIADMIRKKDIDHIHAHWGSTTSTLAWLVSTITGIPWSMTLHRWDIKENNMLRLKAESATFIRCISQVGKTEVLNIIGENLQDKIIVIHMGARIPNIPLSSQRPLRSEFIIACPANLRRVKGHRYLIEACKILSMEEDINIRCLLIGDGHLRREIEHYINRLGMKGIIQMAGQMPHEKLMQLYERKEVDVVVLPSIITDKGEKEGIPVSLMEAMSYGIPVIATETGGIMELLSDGAGLTVKEKSAKELADVIKRLIKEENLYNETALHGFLRIKERFDLYKNTSILLRKIEEKPIDTMMTRIRN